MELKLDTFKPSMIYTVNIIVILLMAFGVYITLKRGDEATLTKVEILEAQVVSANAKISTLIKDIEQKRIADEVKLVASMTLLSDKVNMLEVRNTDLEQLILSKKSK